MGMKCAVQGGCQGYGAARHSSDTSRSGGWVQGARGGTGWIDQGGDEAGARRGGEKSSKQSKNAFVFDFLFEFGCLIGDMHTGWFSV
jgi:hypothetical protein